MGPEVLEELKYFAARFCYEHRHELTPRGVPWTRWFLERYGQSLDEYIKIAQRENHKEKFQQKKD